MDALIAPTPAPPDLSDEALTEKFRDHGYRMGWMEFQLRLARDDLTAALPSLHPGRRVLIELRIASIGRTLRLVSEAIRRNVDDVPPSGHKAHS